MFFMIYPRALPVELALEPRPFTRRQPSVSLQPSLLSLDPVQIILQPVRLVPGEFSGCYALVNPLLLIDYSFPNSRISCASGIGNRRDQYNNYNKETTLQQTSSWHPPFDLTNPLSPDDLHHTLLQSPCLTETCLSTGAL